ncbi:MAG: hypothetical protein Q4E43_00415 [Akkermansia sp.]|nr:hypothetical protein [Akkermansia sp.]
MNALQAIILTAACALPALAAFPQPQQSVKLAYSQQTAVVEFTTDGPAVTKAKPLCDCTTVTIQGNKLIATVDTSKFDQSVAKQIDATTADGKTTRLTMNFEVPPAIILSARSLVWQHGSTPAPQVLTITLPKGSPVTDIKEAGLSGDAFDYVPHKVKDGREYTVTVTPRSTDKPALNRLVLTMVSKDPRFAKQIVYLQVKK